MNATLETTTPCLCCDGRGYKATELDDDKCFHCGGSGKAKPMANQTQMGWGENTPEARDWEARDAEERFYRAQTGKPKPADPIQKTVAKLAEEIASLTPAATVTVLRPRFAVGEAVRIKGDSRTTIYAVYAVGRLVSPDDSYFVYVLQFSLAAVPDDRFYKEDQILGFFDPEPNPPATNLSAPTEAFA